MQTLASYYRKQVISDAIYGAEHGHNADDIETLLTDEMEFNIIADWLSMGGEWSKDAVAFVNCLGFEVGDFATETMERCEIQDLARAMALEQKYWEM